MAGGGADTQGVRDAAVVLPFLAVALFMPPIVLIFTADLSILRLPLIVVYLFGVWAVVIVIAFLLSRRLPRAVSPDEERETGGNVS